MLGPDNGLLAPAVAMVGGAQRAFALTNSSLHLQAPGTTFAGRDVFAPVAAFLCNGGPLEEVGEEIDVAGVMPGLVPVATDETNPEWGDGIRCEVTWVDAYGNCQLNVGPEHVGHLGPVLRVVIGEDRRSVRLADHFAAVAPGAVGAVVDSYGMLALAVDRGSAAETLRLGAGDAVLLFRGDEATVSQVTLRESH